MIEIKGKKMKDVTSGECLDGELVVRKDSLKIVGLAPDHEMLARLLQVKKPDGSMMSPDETVELYTEVGKETLPGKPFWKGRFKID